MWVRFHDELLQGAKRGLSRATRFVYMELASHARPLRGVLELPQGMTLEDGLHDVLGGNRRELLDAFRKLLSVPSSGEETVPMVRVEGVEGGWKVVVVAWKRWNGGDDSARRVREHRARKRTGSEQDRALGDGCNALQPVTVTPPVTAPEESREDQNREIPPNPPSRGETPTGAQMQLDGSAEVVGQKVSRQGKRARPEVSLPENWAPRPAEVAKGHELGFGADRVALEAERFRNHYQAKPKKFADWHAAFRNWLINEARWTAEREGRDGADPTPPESGPAETFTRVLPPRAPPPPSPAPDPVVGRQASIRRTGPRPTAPSRLGPAPWERDPPMAGGTGS